MVLAIVAYLSLRLRNQYAKYATIPPTIIGAMMLTKINSIFYFTKENVVFEYKKKTGALSTDLYNCK